MKHHTTVPGIWGDQGDGTYRNPVLFGDYSDPDCIRVGEDYFLICSEFHFMGMPLLHSRDLVNWQLINRIYAHLPEPQFETMSGYGEGCWAPSIRWHDGIFYVYFCTPKGLYMTCTQDPWGLWEPLHCVKAIEKWEDPCPVWDQDGNAYLGHSVHGAGPILLHRMSADGKTLLDEGQIIYQGPVAEGTKFYIHDGRYYLIIPEGGVPVGWETALRSDHLYGPYERQIVLEQKDSWVNGPHQGALVDTPEGELWFLHFSQSGPAGRVVHLQPGEWRDGWPVLGQHNPGTLCGKPVLHWRKPHLPEQPLCAVQSSDSFANSELGWQWQWNHNPMAAFWSLTERPGHLRLHGLPSEGNMLQVRNVLTQRIQGSCGVIRVTLDVSALAPGQSAGLILLGDQSVCFGILRTGAGLQLLCSRNNAALIPPEEQPLPDDMPENIRAILQEMRKPILVPETLTLQLSYQYLSEVHLAWTPDGEVWPELPLSFSYSIRFPYGTTWKGTRIGLFTRNSGGYADFSNFEYLHDGPQAH